MQLIPAIDLRGGQCVRLYQGDFGAETRYPVSPVALYERYAGLGATWLHVVDLDGARAGNSAHEAIIAELARRRGLKLQVGGGVRSVAVVERLLSLGVERVVAGSLAVTEPDTVAAWLTQYGPERITLALDVRLDAAGVPCLASHGWLEQSTLTLWQAIERYAPVGLRHVLCTDVARDGALEGPNLALYAEARARHPGISWQASGGVRSAADLAALAALGMAAAISGRALLENRIAVEELRPFLPGA